MKKAALALTIILALTGAFLTTSVAFSGADDAQTTSVFDVKGMTCGGCEAGIKIAVKKLDGVTAVKASHEDSQAEVTYDAALVTVEDIVAAIEKIGYEATLKEDA